MTSQTLQFDASEISERALYFSQGRHHISEGAESNLRGMDFSDNPYEKRSTAWKMWNVGYNAINGF